MNDAEPNCTNRVISRISKGYHIKIEGKWRRVDAVEYAQRGGHLVIVTDSGSFPTKTGTLGPSRDAAEQFYAVSALLPMVQRVKVDDRRLGNPFNGSRASGIAHTDIVRVYTA